MSKDLDNKLKQLDIEFLNGVPVHLPDSAIQQIKDCFRANGWAQYMIDLSQPIKNEYEEDLMTGESWYKKFLQELEGTIFAEDDALGALNTCKAAAKRASGVKQ